MDYISYSLCTLLKYWNVPEVINCCFHIGSLSSMKNYELKKKNTQEAMLEHFHPIAIKLSLQVFELYSLLQALTKRSSFVRSLICGVYWVLHQVRWIWLV